MPTLAFDTIRGNAGSDTSIIFSPPPYQPDKRISGNVYLGGICRSKHAFKRRLGGVGYVNDKKSSGIIGNVGISARNIHAICKAGVLYVPLKDGEAGLEISMIFNPTELFAR